MESRQIIGTVIETVIKVVIAALILMFVYRYAIIAYDYGYRIFGEEAMDSEPGRDVSITVTEDYSTTELGKLLEEKGLIRDANLFVIQEKLFSDKKEIAAGTYDLNTAMTVEEMIEAMSSESETETAVETEAESMETETVGEGE